jgi:hypothetical protein
MLALMIAMKSVSTSVFAQNLEIILKECFPEIHMYQDMKVARPYTKVLRIQNQNVRLDESRNSERKEALRGT